MGRSLCFVTGCITSLLLNGSFLVFCDLTSLLLNGSFLVFCDLTSLLNGSFLVFCDGVYNQSPTEWVVPCVL